MALAAVGLMPVLHLWAIDQLHSTHRALHQMSPATLNVRPAKPTAHDAAAVEMLTTPPSCWDSPEMMVSSAGSVLLGGLALAMIFSIVRGGSRHGIAAAGRTLGEPMRVLAGVAEQTRRDMRDTVHAMRTPIGIIMGCSDMLKRTVPPDNAKAWRAIEAINASTVHLNGIVDEARAVAVANLMQSQRELVTLRDLAASIIGPSPARFVICDAAMETSVYGPRAAIEELVRAVIETFAAEGPDAKASMIRFAVGDGTIELQVGRADSDLKAAPVDDLGSNRWPRLHEAARTARLLGGSMDVLATNDQLQRVIVELPSAPRSG